MKGSSTMKYENKGVLVECKQGFERVFGVGHHRLVIPIQKESKTVASLCQIFQMKKDFILFKKV